jgi:hypothetical protein
MSRIPFSRRRAGAAAATASADTMVLEPLPVGVEDGVDLRRRRDQLSARLAELQWDLGGLVYEMAVRDTIRRDVLLRRAAVLQDVDAELSEVERILRMEDTGAAGSCAVCRAPHSSGAVFCWQCGAGLLPQVDAHPASRA